MTSQVLVCLLVLMSIYFYVYCICFDVSIILFLDQIHSEIKTEAECPRDDKPRTGMFAVSTPSVYRKTTHSTLVNHFAKCNVN